ncbi:hypothetical protein DTO002I6_372 [Penicillium roqueforti]|nr:hypothetical protein DTO002I6_372 [Penicillium roqueforti]
MLFSPQLLPLSPQFVEPRKFRFIMGGPAGDGRDSSTPLFWAACEGYEAVVKLLLETGRVNSDSKDSHGKTPLLAAAQHGHEAVVKLLLETGRVNVDSKDSHSETPLLAAAQHGHEAVVKLLLDTGRVDVNSKCAYEIPLFRAAYYGHEAVVKLLLETGHVDLQPKDDPNGWIPLYVAAWHGYEAVDVIHQQTATIAATQQELQEIKHNQHVLQEQNEKLHDEVKALRTQIETNPPTTATKTWAAVAAEGGNSSSLVNSQRPKRDQDCVRISTQRTFVDPRDNDSSDGNTFGRYLSVDAANSHIRTALRSDTAT